MQIILGAGLNSSNQPVIAKMTAAGSSASGIVAKIILLYGVDNTGNPMTLRLSPTGELFT